MATQQPIHDKVLTFPAWTSVNFFTVVNAASHQLGLYVNHLNCNAKVGLVELHSNSSFTGVELGFVPWKPK